MKLKYDEIGLVGDMNDFTVDKENKKNKDYEVKSIYPSGLGYCLRQLYFQSNNYPKDELVLRKTKKNANFLKAAELGIKLHDKICDKWDAMGILVQREEKLELVNGINGKVDARINYGKLYVVEIKTKGSMPFQRALVERGTRAEKIQLGYYMHRKQLPGIYFLYNTDTKDEVYFIYDLNCDWVMLAKERAEVIGDACAEMLVPPKEEGKSCQYCKYLTECKRIQ